MEFETHIAQLDYLMGVTYLYIPANIVQELGGLKCGRLVCTVNNKSKFQCGLMSLSEGAAYITFNKTRLKSLKLKTGDQVLVKLEKDESEFGFDLCEELTELFKQAPESFERFKRLKPGMQRQLIYYSGNAKSAAVRMERCIKMVTRLERIPEGQETFKLLFGKQEDL